MKKLIKITLFFIAFVMYPTGNAAVQEIKVLDSNGSQIENNKYIFALLDEVLSVTRPEFGDYKIKFVEFSSSQSRSLRFLNEDGILDVMHTMTNKTREESLTAIKIPLLKGLMGHRLLITSAEKFDEIKKITRVEHLKRLVTCQGLHWPDSDILENNQFQVARVLIFESMFEMVSKGRCDIFPRGIHEINPEVDAFTDKYPNLRIVDNIMLHYYSPVYFFVGKRNKALATRIEMGLNRLIKTGRFDELLMTSSTISRILPLEKWNNSRVFQLNSEVDNNINPSYLLNLGQKK